MLIIKLGLENTNNALSFGLKSLFTDVQENKGVLPGSSRPPNQRLTFSKRLGGQGDPPCDP